MADLIVPGEGATIPVSLDSACLDCHEALPPPLDLYRGNDLAITESHAKHVSLATE